MSKAYLVGKGRSLDNVKKEWFDGSPVWCLNQSTTVIRPLVSGEVHCVQNDAWIQYVPPDGVTWHCGLEVESHGRACERYCPETVTEHWASPSCLCALELMRREGVQEIVMVGFDSYFDSSRSYAKVIGVNSKCDANFNDYNTVMRRWAVRHGVMLRWMDGNGVVHDDLRVFRQCVLGVAMGGEYEQQTDRMIGSFLKYNLGWDAEKFYGKKLENALPNECRMWPDKYKCKIGKWIAMKALLDKYDTVLYCDGDVRWYGEYEPYARELVLTPNCVSKKACYKTLLKEKNFVNTGVVEASRGFCSTRLLDLLVKELTTNTYLDHGEAKMIFQNPELNYMQLGFDILMNPDFGMNVGLWNLNRHERSLSMENGRYMVHCMGQSRPLKSFHFSKDMLEKLREKGEIVVKLLGEYQHEK